MEKHLKKVSLIAALGIGAALLVLFACDPAQVGIFPVCLFHRWTGLNCPGCGSLRALHQLLHGNLRAALHLNAAVVISVPIFAWLAFRLVRQWMSGKPGMTIRPQWLWVYFAGWLIFGVLRELPVPMFAAWSP